MRMVSYTEVYVNAGTADVTLTMIADPHFAFVYLEMNTFIVRVEDFRLQIHY